MLVRCSTFAEWTISSLPGISSAAMAARTSFSALCDTLFGVAVRSPGSGVADTGPAASRAARSPWAAVATPRRLRRVRVESCNRVTVVSLTDGTDDADGTAGTDDD